MNSYLCFLPPILTLILALWSKNIFLALFLGTVCSSVLVNGINFISPIMEVYMVNGITGNLSVLIMMAIFGIMMTLIRRGGGFAAFSKLVGSRIKSRRAAMFWTWLLSTLITDGTVATVGIGSVMRPIADQHKVPREKQGMILSSCAPAMCSLVPWTIYILFYSGMIQACNPDLVGTAEYLKMIPFNFYAMISVIFALLVALDILPNLGYMKKCEERTEKTGELFKPGTENTANAGIDVTNAPEGVRPSLAMFFIPFAVSLPLLIVTYLTTGMVVLTTSFACGLIVAFLYALITKRIKASEIPDILVEGAGSMAPVIVLLVFAFTFSKAVSAIGLAEFTSALLSGVPFSVMPCLVFASCAVISYACGSLVSAVTMLTPIAISLGCMPGANLSLILAACLGGCMFGDQTSPLSDMVVQSASGAGVDVVELGKAQFPAKAVMACVTAVVFLIAGFAV